MGSEEPILDRSQILMLAILATGTVLMMIVIAIIG